MRFSAPTVKILGGSMFNTTTHGKVTISLTGQPEHDDFLAITDALPEQACLVGGIQYFDDDEIWTFEW